MNGLSRLFPRGTFAALRALRAARPCAAASLAARPAYERVALRTSRQATLARATAVEPLQIGFDAVRVYRGPARLVLVGRIDAVASMLDSAIAAEGAGYANVFGV